MDVGNLISGSSAFSKSSLNIWKFTVHILLKPGLENFEHFFACMWGGHAAAAAAASAAAKSLQSCLTLCSPRDGSPPGSPIPGILQAKILEWIAISFSNAWKWKVKVKPLSYVQLLATPWTAAYQAPPSMGFSRQEFWNRVPLPSPATVHGVTQNWTPLSTHKWNVSSFSAQTKLYFFTLFIQTCFLPNLGRRRTHVQRPTPKILLGHDSF